LRSEGKYALGARRVKPLSMAPRSCCAAIILPVWNWLPVVIGFATAIVMLVRARGLRGDVAPLAPAFACAAGFCATLGARGYDLTGASLVAPLGGVLLSVPILIACVLCTFVRTATWTLESRPVPRLVHVVIAIGIATIVVIAALQTRGHAQPGSIPSACSVGTSTVGERPFLIHDRDVNVAGPSLDYAPQMTVPTSCSLSIETRTVNTKIGLPPPIGYSGSYRCNATWVAVCSDAGVVLIKADTGGPLGDWETKGLLLPDLTPAGVTAPTIGSRLAPPWPILALAAIGLLTAIIGLLPRGDTKSKEPNLAGYRAAAERDEPPSDRAPPALVARVPITVAVAVALAMPLCATLVIR